MERTYKVVASFDTETCNMPQDDGTALAYPILYILNDFSACDLRHYMPDMLGENVTYDRYAMQFLERLQQLISQGLRNSYTPIVCAYNLMFDMQSLMYSLAQQYDMQVSAQSTTNVYTLDLYAKGANKDKAQALLRFWDTFFLEQNGLKAMGATAGLPKAVGEWDYSLIRTPETPLTELELHYAKRDVQVIPAYLRYLLEANEWMSVNDLGVRILTKTSVVRRFAAETFGDMSIGHDRKGRDVSMLHGFQQMCMQDMPKDYETYALRKACFRGGWTFTAGDHAMQTMVNVASLDVTSMHHTFINGMYIPKNWHKATRWELGIYMQHVLDTTPSQVLARYVQPFNCAFHACFRFKRIRPRKDSVFAKHGIWLAPRGKFAHAGENGEWIRSESDTLADAAIRERGFHDRARNARFAFGKLVSCDEAQMFLNEIELWTMGQVYEWDSLSPVFGECTVQFRRPPEYVILQSNLLYKRKNDCKRMSREYDGTPYKGDIPSTIPLGLVSKMRDGTLSREFLRAYYGSTVKGAFNAVYGTQAQDVFKPDYLVEEGEIVVDAPVTPANYRKRMPKTCKVLYTYGMRIVARSRMHLALALMLLDAEFGDRITPTGGDTDSIKCACDDDVTDESIKQCLMPIATASEKAISVGCAYIRRTWPQFASDMKDVGSFDIEECSQGSTRYDHHMELWNKARVSETNGEYHVTCAGLSRPEGTYHIEHALHDLHMSCGGFARVCGTAIGYNVSVAYNISHSLQRKRPQITETIDTVITDYLGVSARVNVPMAIALYGESRVLGDVTKQTNYENCQYLRSIGVHIDVRQRELNIEDGSVFVENGLFEELILKGQRE